MNTPFEAELEVVTTLAGRARDALMHEMRLQDQLTVALRASLADGVLLSDLSEASGLTPEQILARTESRDLIPAE